MVRGLAPIPEVTKLILKSIAHRYTSEEVMADLERHPMIHRVEEALEWIMNLENVLFFAFAPDCTRVLGGYI